MADKSTYIKLDRNMRRWRWWTNRNTLQVFIWLLFEANVSDHDFENETIHRGQVATSIGSIANQCNLTTSEVRTALSHLKSTGEITTSLRPHYQVITIVGYHRYQDVASKNTGETQADRKQIASKSQQYKNGKNIKNGKNKVADAPDSPPGIPERGTKLWKAKSHLLLKRDEGTVDDIPDDYREMFNNFSDYWGYRNQ